MATIEVDHQVLRDVAAAITAYCSAQDREMHAADAEIRAMLNADWVGMDAQAFGRKWIGVNGSDSIAVHFRDSLKNYGESLTACASEYQRAQEDVYNAANRLPKILLW